MRLSPQADEKNRRKEPKGLRWPHPSRDTFDTHILLMARSLSKYTISRRPLPQHEKRGRVHDPKRRRTFWPSSLHVQHLPHTLPLGRLACQLPTKDLEGRLSKRDPDAAVVEYLPFGVQLHRESATEKLHLVDEGLVVEDNLGHLAYERSDLAIGTALGHGIEQFVWRVNRVHTLSIGSPTVLAKAFEAQMPYMCQRAVCAPALVSTRPKVPWHSAARALAPLRLRPPRQRLQPRSPQATVPHLQQLWQSHGCCRGGVSPNLRIRARTRSLLARW